MTKFKAILKTVNNTVVVVSCIDKSFCKNLEESGLLKNGVVDVLEASYQAALCRVLVDDECGWDKAVRLLSMIGAPLSLFLVYVDLRLRGRKVVRGARKNTLLLMETPLRIHEILVLEEGSKVTLTELIEWTKRALADNHNPVIAIVDREGDITYYESRAVTALI